MYTSADEIEILVQGFNAKTLEKEKWTHAAHLTGAVWYLKRYNFEEAVTLIRKAIAEYNVAVGGQNTTTGGYHETMTIFWMTVADFFVRSNTSLTILDTCNALLSSPLAERTLPFYFYEKDTILSVKARAAYVQPDKEAVNDETLGRVLRDGALLNAES